MKKIAGVTLALAAGLALTGCFDVEQTLILDKNLAGKAGFAMKVDMEPMVVFMARMQREMAGQTGEPTQEEIEKAKKEFLASKKEEKGQDFASQKAEMQKNLPAGVKLLDGTVKDDGLKIAANFLFGFDNVSKLSQINLSSKDKPEAAGPGGQNPFNEPFLGLQVKDEGKTLLVTTPAVNPVADQKAQTAEMDLDPSAKKMIEDAFKGVRVAFKIQAPFEVIEHNATRKEGNTLIWEYDMASFEKMTPEQAAQGVRVRYRK
jgi:hypothetical protein